MTKWYRGLNADIGTIQAKDELDDRGSEAPGAGGIPAPKRAKFVRRIIPAGATQGDAVGNLILFLRLEGDGMENDETYMVDGFSIPALVGTTNHNPAKPSPILNFPVHGGSKILIFGDSEGDAESDFELGVTLELVDEKEPPTENLDAEIRTRSFAVDVDPADTVVDFTTGQGSNTGPTKEVPTGSKEHPVTVLRWMKVVWGVDEAGDGVAVLFVRLKGEWVKNSPHIIYTHGHGNIAGTAGSDEGVTHGEFFLDDMNLEVEVGSDIEMDVEMAGEDLGSGTAGITFGFA